MHRQGACRDQQTGYSEGEKQVQTNQVKVGRVRRAVNELVLAEMFLVQATVESANVIGERIDELKRQLNGEQEGSLGELLQRTADEAVEPYSTRFRHLRIMLDDDRS